MKLAIMQPYFLPYLGYWQLINAVDKFVILDDVNFIKKGYISRNVIQCNGEQIQIKLSIKKVSQNKFIKDHYINWDETIWINKMMKSLEMSYSKAPYFNDVMYFLTPGLNSKIENLSEYLFLLIKRVTEYLNISTEIVDSSAKFKTEGLKGQDRIISICNQLRNDIYINPIGGMELYSNKIFEDNGIDLFFLKMKQVSYKQNDLNFVPNLSIIDIMMFNSVDHIKVMLNEFDLVKND